MDGRRGDGLTIGLFGIGLDAYWPQFAGLEDRLKGYIARVAELLDQSRVNVANLTPYGLACPSRDAR
jgi:hypothetical protein